MWYVMQVMSTKEFSILNKIKQLTPKDDTEYFIPMYEQYRKIQKKATTVKKVLFPGYVFISTDDIDLVVENLKKVPDFTQILKCGDEIVPLKKCEERFLKNFINKDKTIEMSIGHIVGEDVIITEGPMKNFNGKIKKINRHKRQATIEIQFMETVKNVTIGLEIISKV